ncbi:GAP family protein [Candidatus Collierbacteria bacterium]|nr:GAP family protein [Candidatus Collierbacteria bacterium]
MTLGFPALTTAALINGINPCGIGMMITFLGYLLVFGVPKKKSKLPPEADRQKLENSKILASGVVYIVTVFVTYLLIGLIFYSLAFYLQRLWLAMVFKYLMGGAVLIAGLIQLKDGVWPESPIHLRMPSFGGRKISQMMEKMSLPMAALVGVATTAFSTPCMLPLYVGTASLLANSGLPIGVVLTYFLYYNLIFISPLILILVVMYKGKDIVVMKELEHKYGRWMRLLMGVLLVIVGYLIIFR